MCVSAARQYLCHFTITVFALAAAIGQADAHSMLVAVHADVIMIGTDAVPRFLDLPRVLVVPAGATVTAAADSTWDYIEVAGTLRVARDHDTVLRFTHCSCSRAACWTSARRPIRFRPAGASS